MDGYAELSVQLYIANIAVSSQKVLPLLAMYLRAISIVLVSMDGPGVVVFVDRAEPYAEDYHSYNRGY